MSSMTCRIATAAMLVAILSACNDAPTAPARDALAPSAPALTASATSGAERWIEEDIYDLTGALVAYPCGESGYTEQILMEGKVFVRYTLTWDGAGGIHALTHSMPIGLRGVGQTTGAEYRVTEREHGTFNQGEMGQTLGTYQSVLRIASQELGLRGRLTLGGTYVINANGEWIFDRPILRADCSE
jgi:hypothetical protein